MISSHGPIGTDIWGYPGTAIFFGEMDGVSSQEEAVNKFESENKRYVKRYYGKDAVFLTRVLPPQYPGEGSSDLPTAYFEEGGRVFTFSFGGAEVDSQMGTVETIVKHMKGI